MEQGHNYLCRLKLHLKELLFFHAYYVGRLHTLDGLLGHNSPLTSFFSPCFGQMSIAQSMV